LLLVSYESLLFFSFKLPPFISVDDADDDVMRLVWLKPRPFPAGSLGRHHHGGDAHGEHLRRAAAAAQPLGPHLRRGLNKLNAVDPQLETAWFQPLNLSNEKNGFKVRFLKCNSCTATLRWLPPASRLRARLRHHVRLRRRAPGVQAGQRWGPCTSCECS
jgi:hypothetical protein